MKTNVLLLITLATPCAVQLSNSRAAASAPPHIVLTTNLGRQIWGVVFSPDSQMVLTLGNPSKLWRLPDANLLRSFLIPGTDGYVDAIAGAFSPDGSTVTVVGSEEGGPRQWRISDGTVIWAWSSGAGDLDLSPDGTQFAVGTDSTSWALSLVSNDPSRQRRIFSKDVCAGRVSFSRDGTWLASGGCLDERVRIWRVSDGALLQTLRQFANPQALDFTPDGKTLAVGTSSTDTRLYLVTNDAPPRILASGETRSLKFSPDGKLLLTVSLGRLMFWRVRDGVLLKVYEDDLGLYDARADISPNGKLFAYNRHDTLVVARMPVLLDEPKEKTNHLNFDWQGGSGLYQVQQTTSVTSAVWANVGPPTAATNLTVPRTNATAFFRVQSLPGAP